MRRQVVLEGANVPATFLEAHQLGCRGADGRVSILAT